MKKITVKMIMKEKPCYEEREVKKLIKNGRTPLQILYLKIPAEDRIWALNIPGVLTARERRLFAADCAERVIRQYINLDDEKKPLGKTDITKMLIAIDAARKFAMGKIPLLDMLEIQQTLNPLRLKVTGDETSFLYVCWYAVATKNRDIGTHASGNAIEAMMSMDRDGRGWEREAKVEADTQLQFLRKLLTKRRK